MSNIYRISLLFSLLVSYSIHGLAQNECGHSTLVANEEKYSIGKFYECMDGLKPCLEKNGFGYDDKKDALQLVANCYMAIDSVERADECIEQLLRMSENYQPDNYTLQRFRTEVNIVRSRMRATQIASVSKKNEDINLAPATIQIITEQEILRRGYKDVEEILSDVPGFDISRVRGVSYSVLYQRGYRTSANTDRTMIMIDGVEDNDMWSNAAYISKQFPISNIKRIEIIYGPSSTIYGANAYAGVINIVTKGVEDIFSKNNNNKVTTTAQVGGGSFNTYYSNATIAARLRNTFFSVTGGMYHSDEEDLSKYKEWDGNYDYSDATYQAGLTLAYSAKNDSILNVIDPGHLYYQSSSDSIRPTPYAISQARAMDKANYRKTFRGVDPGKFSNPKNDYYLSSKLSIGDFKFQFEYFDRNEGIAPDYSQKLNAMNSALQNWQVRQGFISARYDKIISDKLTLSSSSYYRISDRGKNAVLTPYVSYASAGFSASKGIPLDSLAKGVQPYFNPLYKSTQSNQFRTELRAQYTLNDRLDFTGGIELRNGLLQGDYVNSSLPDPLTNGFAHDSASYYSVTDLGIFMLGSYNNAHKRFNINVGGRMDYDVINGHYGYGSVFNPRVAFIYYPSKYIFKAIYSEAFLDASPFNKFATTSTRALSNPTLKPEKVKNIEVSGKYKLDKKSFVEVAYYCSWYSNSIVSADVIYNGVKTTQFQASGRARIQGVQLSAETSVSIFSFYANATFTDPYSINSSKIAGDDSVTRMGDIADFSANAGVNVKFLENFNVNVRANYVGDKPTGKGTTTASNPYTSTPGYTVFHGTIGYRIRQVGILQFRVDNILDELYYSPGTRSASGAQSSRVPQPGRIYYAQFILNLK